MLASNRTHCLQRTDGLKLNTITTIKAYNRKLSDAVPRVIVSVPRFIVGRNEKKEKHFRLAASESISPLLLYDHLT